MNMDHPNNLYGFWGPTTSTIDWCEKNYEYSYYIAEFWNTLSNLAFIVLSIYGMKRCIEQGFESRFLAQYLVVMIIGIGSALFHGTLRYFEQQCDETPMIWGILGWIYVVYSDDWSNNRKLRLLMPYFLVTFGILFAILHAYYRFTTGFQLLFGALSTICLYRLCEFYRNVRNPHVRRVGQSYLVTAFIGVSLWLMDYHLCHIIKDFPINPQGHAWWHLFMALNSYYGPVFMQYVRAEQLKWNPSIDINIVGLPVVVVNREKQYYKKDDYQFVWWNFKGLSKFELS